MARNDFYAIILFVENKKELSQEELLSIISELTGKVQSLETEKSNLLERNRLLENTILLFKMKTFGKKSEKISSDQLYLFNEAEKYFESENQEENDNDDDTEKTKPSNARPNCCGPIKKQHAGLLKFGTTKRSCACFLGKILV